MMRTWIEFLPLFIVRRLAKRCETFNVQNAKYALVRPGVLVKIED